MLPRHVLSHGVEVVTQPAAGMLHAQHAIQRGQYARLRPAGAIVLARLIPDPCTMRMCPVCNQACSVDGQLFPGVCVSGCSKLRAFEPRSAPLDACTCECTEVRQCSPACGQL